MDKMFFLIRVGGIGVEFVVGFEFCGECICRGFEGFLYFVVV